MAIQIVIGGDESDPDEVGLNDRQSLLEDAVESIAEALGQFDQSSGPDGAHYFPGDQNPFAANGIMCQNCVFWEDGTCDVVAGDIDPDGVCKLWIIPADGMIGKAKKATVFKGAFLG